MDPEFLSKSASPSSEWAKVAANQRALDKKAKKLYSLPLHEFRKQPYRPAPLSSDAPVPGRDLSISQRDVRVRDGTTITVRVYQPLELTGNHVLFFNIHGGGWTVGSPESEEGQNRIITVRNDAVVVSVDYRKAPEFPFPYALNDSYDALLWTLANAKSLGADPTKTIIGGGSAGANVATVIARIARDESINGIIGHENSSYEENMDAPIVDAERMRWFWRNYLPGCEADSRASPLLDKSLAGLPPALVQVAGMDPLRDEGIAYAEALEANGVDVALKLYPGLPHGFYIYPDLESTIEYYQTMIDWIQHLVKSLQ